MKIITGMHRSGTSLVARLLFEAGADLGPPETLYAGDKWNPDGYYEQPDIHAVNMPLINGMFWKFAYFWLPSTATIMRRARRRAKQIRSTATAYGGKVIKETRFCLTLPAWLEHGAQVDGLLVCLREPFAVASSIKKRNRVPLSIGYRLWLTHNQRLLAAAGELPMSFVRYDHLLDEERYAGETDRALRFFGLERPSAEIEQLGKRCVKRWYNHAPPDAERHPPEVAALWRDLRDRHASQQTAGRPAAGPGTRDQRAS